MNKTKIDWCDYSWNPVTGCLHGCEYCYARRIANRFGEHRDEKGVVELHYKRDNPYPYDFYPTFHKYRLDEPSRKTKGVNIFVCSMADLFGEWVPDEWIQKVFKACEKAPQHRYLFLTKNPGRYIKLYDKNILPNRDNLWLGTTCTTSRDEFIWFKDMNFKSFISIEPILEPFGELVNPDFFTDWVIIGAETGNRKDKVIPKKEWIMEIKEQCRNAGVPIFMKESLRELMGQDFVQEFPWESDN